MKSKHFRKLAWQDLHGRWGEAAILSLVFFLLYSATCSVAGAVPLIGSLAIIVLAPIMQFGYLKEMILFKNGAKVECIDFFKFGFTNFVKVMKVYGWMLLKFIGPFILYFVGCAILMVQVVLGFVSDYVYTRDGEYYYNNYDRNETYIYEETYSPDIPAIKPNESSSSTIYKPFNIINIIMAIMTWSCFVGAWIWTTMLSLKYGFVFYELVYNPDMPAKEIVNLSGRKMLGNRWKLFKLQMTFTGWFILCVLGLGIPFLWISPYMMISTVLFYEYVSQKYNAQYNNITTENTNTYIDNQAEKE